MTAALRARELGAAVTLIERDGLGGTCTNDGCVPTRVVAKAARLPRSIAIVGAAATVCQLASVFDAFGSRVMLLDLHGHRRAGCTADRARVRRDATSAAAASVGQGECRRMRADGHPVPVTPSVTIPGRSTGRLEAQ